MVKKTPNLENFFKLLMSLFRSHITCNLGMDAGIVLFFLLEFPRKKIGPRSTAPLAP